MNYGKAILLKALQRLLVLEVLSLYLCLVNEFPIKILSGHASNAV